MHPPTTAEVNYNSASSTMSSSIDPPFVVEAWTESKEDHTWQQQTQPISHQPQEILEQTVDSHQILSLQQQIASLQWHHQQLQQQYARMTGKKQGSDEHGQVKQGKRITRARSHKPSSSTSSSTSSRRSSTSSTTTSRNLTSRRSSLTNETVASRHRRGSLTEKPSDSTIPRGIEYDFDKHDEGHDVEWRRVKGKKGPVDVLKSHRSSSSHHRPRTSQPRRTNQSIYDQIVEWEYDANQSYEPPTYRDTREYAYQVGFDRPIGLAEPLLQQSNSPPPPPTSHFVPYHHHRDHIQAGVGMEEEKPKSMTRHYVNRSSIDLSTGGAREWTAEEKHDLEMIATNLSTNRRNPITHDGYRGTREEIIEYYKARAQPVTQSVLGRLSTDVASGRVRARRQRPDLLTTTAAGLNSCEKDLRALHLIQSRRRGNSTRMYSSTEVAHAITDIDPIDDISPPMRTSRRYTKNGNASSIEMIQAMEEEEMRGPTTLRVQVDAE